MYELDKKQTLLLISGYNALLRLKIINRWEELEKPKELSRLEILTLALEAEKKVIELQEKIEVDKPKVEFAEQLLSATNSLDFGTSCKAMNLPFGRNKMFEICRKLNFIMHNNQPYQTYIDQGYFTLLETSYVNAKSGDRVLTTKTMVTAKGQNWLINNFKKNGLM
jgi:phage antirepressor YoqD-like protein